jgi:hypothetical protein
MGIHRSQALRDEGRQHPHIPLCTTTEDIMNDTRASQLRLPDPALLGRMAISENGFVFDPVTGNSFTLNATGLALLRIFQQNPSMDDVLASVAKDFDVPPSEVERDVMEFSAVLCGSMKP